MVCGRFVAPLDSPDGAPSVFVWVNFVPKGIVRVSDAQRLVDHLRSLRRSRVLPPDVSVYGGRSGVYVASLPGTFCRPLLVAETSELCRAVCDRALSFGRVWSLWSDLCTAGCLVYRSKDEELSTEDCYTDVHPMLNLGWVTAGIPLSNHNQAPRVIYQCGMAKQAIGGSVCITSHREHHRQWYTQHPLVHTSVELDASGRTSFNAVVAVMALNGYNVEDSVILKRSSVERGMATLDTIKIYRSQTSSYERNSHMSPRFVPGKCRMRRHRTYDTINRSGVPRVGARIEKGDVVIGKVAKQKDGTYADQSIVHSYSFSVVVQSVTRERSTATGELITVATRQTRVCGVGDKVASRHAQKGTVGVLMNDEDMPHNRHGVSPDIIINPHCLPSRMTVGHLMEMICGKAASLKGSRQRCNPFADIDLTGCQDALSRRGWQRSGCETYYDGRTGKKMGSVFVGCIAYQRLKHMVIDKIHARATGPRSLVTRQPLEGRARNGGLRIGEMERDALIASGATTMLQDRMLHHSDGTQVDVCVDCGLIAKDEKSCGACGSHAKPVRVTIPHATLVLYWELMSLGVLMRLRVGESG